MLFSLPQGSCQTALPLNYLTPYEGLIDFLLLQLRKTNALLTTENVKNTNIIILSDLIWVLWFKKYYFHNCFSNITHYLPGCFAHCFLFHLRCIAYAGRSCVAPRFENKTRWQELSHPTSSLPLMLRIALGKLSVNTAYQVPYAFLEGVETVISFL